MMMLYSNLPQIDLHGYDRDYARIVINDFINLLNDGDKNEG
jgi:DNA-nicking Smr family endonuclease